MFELSAMTLDAFLGFGIKMLVFLSGLAALIFVHELGHFLVAIKVGVVVEKFSLGFAQNIQRDPRGHRVPAFRHPPGRLRKNERRRF